MKISIGCDHAAWELKEKVKQYLSTKSGIEVDDKGCYSPERCDYPDFGHAVAKDVTENKCDFGILMCGSGNGINMTANKWSGVRSALCWNSEIANMARLHNDANILTLPGRYISEKEAFKCVDEFINTGFEGGRHGERINKIPKWKINIFFKNIFRSIKTHISEVGKGLQEIQDKGLGSKS
jgi:ribose 5-phosphate isomerase B